VLATLDRLLTKLESDPMQLHRELDWVIKRQLIENFMNRHRLSWRDPKVSLLDLQYHDIRPDKGVYYRLVANDHVDRTTDDETIEQAKHVPPQTTRARCGRVHPPGEPEGQGLSRGLGLSEIERSERETILCKDPFQSHDEAGRAPDPLLLARRRSSGLLLEGVARGCPPPNGVARTYR